MGHHLGVTPAGSSALVRPANEVDGASQQPCGGLFGSKAAVARQLRAREAACMALLIGGSRPRAGLEALKSAASVVRHLAASGGLSPRRTRSIPIVVRIHVVAPFQGRTHASVEGNGLRCALRAGRHMLLLPEGGSLRRSCCRDCCLRPPAGAGYLGTTAPAASRAAWAWLRFRRRTAAAPPSDAAVSPYIGLAGPRSPDAGAHGSSDSGDRGSSLGA